MKNPLPRFVLLTLAWLPIAFTVWYLGAPLLLAPAALLAEGVLRGLFADIVSRVDTAGAIVSVITRPRQGCQSVPATWWASRTNGPRPRNASWRVASACASSWSAMPVVRSVVIAVAPQRAAWARSVTSTVSASR